MPHSKPVPTLVRYTPKSGQESALLTLIQAHWQTLKAQGLSTDEPAKIWRARDARSDAVCFFELFSWKDGTASDRAHTTPEVMAVWEPMRGVLESMQIFEVEAL